MPYSTINYDLRIISMQLSVDFITVWTVIKNM